MNTALTKIEVQGNVVSMAIDSLTSQVLQNADDGVELCVLDIELVEAVLKASKSAQGFQHATLYWMRQKRGYLILGYESFEAFGSSFFLYKFKYCISKLKISKQCAIVAINENDY